MATSVDLLLEELLSSDDEDNASTPRIASSEHTGKQLLSNGDTGQHPDVHATAPSIISSPDLQPSTHASSLSGPTAHLTVGSTGQTSTSQPSTPVSLSVLPATNHDRSTQQISTTDKHIDTDMANRSAPAEPARSSSLGAASIDTDGSQRASSSTNQDAHISASPDRTSMPPQTAEASRSSNRPFLAADDDTPQTSFHASQVLETTGVPVPLEEGRQQLVSSTTEHSNESSAPRHDTNCVPSANGVAAGQPPVVSFDHLHDEDSCSTKGGSVAGVGEFDGYQSSREDGSVGDVDSLLHNLHTYGAQDGASDEADVAVDNTAAPQPTPLSPLEAAAEMERDLMSGGGCALPVATDGEEGGAVVMYSIAATLMSRLSSAREAWHMGDGIWEQRGSIVGSQLAMRVDVVGALAEAFNPARVGGVPQCVAMYRSCVALGMSSGMILLLMPRIADPATGGGPRAALMRLGDATSHGSQCTTLCFSGTGAYLLAGYRNGELALWEFRKSGWECLKVIKEGHSDAVVCTAFLEGTTLAAVSGDAGGRLCYHNLAAYLSITAMFTGRLSRGPQPTVLQEGGSLGALVSCTPLLAPRRAIPQRPGAAGTQQPDIGRSFFFQDGASVVDGLLLVSCLRGCIVYRINSDGRPHVVTTLKPPRGVREDAVPVAAWKMNMTDAGQGVHAMLAVCWEAYIMVVAVPIASGQSRSGDGSGVEEGGRRRSFGRSTKGSEGEDVVPMGSAVTPLAEWQMDHMVAAVNWLEGHVIAVLSDHGPRTHIDVYELSGVSASLRDHCVVDDSLVGHQLISNRYGVPEVVHVSSATSWGDRLLMLGTEGVRVASFMGWQERLNSLHELRRWELSLTLGCDMWLAAQQSTAQQERSDQFMWHLNLQEVQPQAVAEVMMRLLLHYTDVVLTEAAAQQTSEALAQVARAADTCIQLCILLQRQDILFRDVFRKFQSAVMVGPFVEQLQPYILQDLLKQLDPEVVQALVEHFSGCGRTQAVEQAVLHLDIPTLDFNQVARLCRSHKLYSALIYIFNRGLGDYITPVCELLREVAQGVYWENNKQQQEQDAEDENTRYLDVTASGGAQHERDSREEFGQHAAVDGDGGAQLLNEGHSGMVKQTTLAGVFVVDGNDLGRGGSSGDGAGEAEMLSPAEGLSDDGLSDGFLSDLDDEPRELIGPPSAPVPTSVESVGPSNASRYKEDSIQGSETGDTAASRNVAGESSGQETKETPLDMSGWRQKYGYKLLVYLQCSFKGHSFPPGGGLLDADVRQVVKAQLLALLMYGDPDVLQQLSPNFIQRLISPFPGVTTDVMLPGPHPALRLLCAVDPCALLQVLQEALHGWEALECDLIEGLGVQGKMASRNATATQVVVDAVMDLLAANGFHVEPSPQPSGAVEDALEGPSSAVTAYALHFVTQQLCGGRAVASGPNLLPILQYIALGPWTGNEPTMEEKEHMFMSVLQHAVCVDAGDTKVLQGLEETRVLQLAQAAGLTAAESHVYHLQGKYDAALKCLASRQSSSTSVFQYIANALDAPNATHTMRQQLHEAIQRHIGSLIEVDAEAAAKMVLERFPDDHITIVTALQEHPRQQFKYLKGAMSLASLVEGDNADQPPTPGGTTSLQSASHVHQRLMSTPQLCELFVKLLCKFDPHAVLPFLQSHDSYRVEVVLTEVESAGVNDGHAYLLERLGDVQAALNIYVADIQSTLRRLVSAVLEEQEVVLPRTHRGSGRGPATTTYDMSRIIASARGRAVGNMTSPRVVSDTAPPLLLDAHRALKCGVSVCQRHAMDTPTQVGQKMWFSVLEQYVNMLRELRQQQRHVQLKQKGKADEVKLDQMCELQSVLASWLEEVISYMAGYVPLKLIGQRIMRQYGQDQFGDFKGTLLGLLAAYHYECSILETARRLTSSDAFRLCHINFSSRTRCCPLDEVTVYESAPRRPPRGRGASWAAESSWADELRAGPVIGGEGEDVADRERANEGAGPSGEASGGEAEESSTDRSRAAKLTSGISSAGSFLALGPKRLMGLLGTSFQDGSDPGGVK